MASHAAALSALLTVEHLAALKVHLLVDSLDRKSVEKMVCQ